jgi:hypothetical protein
LISIYPLFSKFSKDEIWGVRKVCLEKTGEIIELFKDKETKQIKECLEFVELGF